jgi:hypothetical protein
MFRPRSFSLPRRFTPPRPCRCIATGCRPWGSPRFARVRNRAPRGVVLPSEALLSIGSNDAEDCSSPPGWRHRDVFPFRDAAYTANLAFSLFIPREPPGPRLRVARIVPEAGTPRLCSTDRAVPQRQVALPVVAVAPMGLLVFTRSLLNVDRLAARVVANPEGDAGNFRRRARAGNRSSAPANRNIEGGCPETEDRTARSHREEQENVKDRSRRTASRSETFGLPRRRPDRKQTACQGWGTGEGGISGTHWEKVFPI